MNQTEQILHNQAIIMKALQALITRTANYDLLLSQLDTAILKSEQEHGYESRTT